MTYEEAKEALKVINLSRVHPFYSWEEMLNVRDKAIEALEKQISKKFEVFNGQDFCPTCHSLFGNDETRKRLIIWEMDYCKYCGQKLDWGDEE